MARFFPRTALYTVVLPAWVGLMNMRGAQCGYVQEHAIDVGDTPDLAGFDVARIRIAVRGEPRVHGRFLSELYVSGELALSATAFTIPPGVLAAGKR